MNFSLRVICSQVESVSTAMAYAHFHNADQTLLEPRFTLHSIFNFTIKQTRKKAEPTFANPTWVYILNPDCLRAFSSFLSPALMDFRSLRRSALSSRALSLISSSQCSSKLVKTILTFSGLFNPGWYIMSPFKFLNSPSNKHKNKRKSRTSSMLAGTKNLQ